MNNNIATKNKRYKAYHAEKKAKAYSNVSEKKELNGNLLNFYRKTEWNKISKYPEDLTVEDKVKAFKYFYMNFELEGYNKKDILLGLIYLFDLKTDFLRKYQQTITTNI